LEFEIEEGDIVELKVYIKELQIYSDKSFVLNPLESIGVGGDCTEKRLSQRLLP
jgi:hypothetical protein